jgi:hypothetical protein
VAALCLDHDIRAMQSVPARGCDERPLGTFVVGYREPRAPGQWNVELRAMGARLTGLALQAQLA